MLLHDLIKEDEEEEGDKATKELHLKLLEANKKLLAISIKHTAVYKCD